MHLVCATCQLRPTNTTQPNASRNVDKTVCCFGCFRVINIVFRVNLVKLFTGHRSNPAYQTAENLDPTQPSPTCRLTQPMDNSGRRTSHTQSRDALSTIRISSSSGGAEAKQVLENLAEVAVHDAVDERIDGRLT